MPDRPACRALKKNGRPCRAPALRAGSAEPSDAKVAAIAARCRPEEDSEEASW